MPAKNLFEQTSEGGRMAAAMLCGISGAYATFNNTLRELEPMPEGFSVGDIARAYLTAKLREIDAARAANVADRDRVIEIRFTPAQRAAVLHRLEIGDNIEEVLGDTEELSHLSLGAAKRAAELAAALAADPDCVLRINGTEQDAEIVVETIEGSTWNGVHDSADVTPQARAAARRALEGAAGKIAIALGREPLHIPEA